MTLLMNPSEVNRAGSAEVPVIVCIALDHDRRRWLASLLDGVGVVMFTRDLATAHELFGRQLGQGEALEEAPDEAPDNVVRAGELEIDQARCRAAWRGVALPLTRLERDLLASLASRPARVWSYRQLHEMAWSGRYLDPGPLHAAIKRLRRKLRGAGVALRIDAVRGVGYQLIEQDHQT